VQPAQTGRGNARTQNDGSGQGGGAGAGGSTCTAARHNSKTPEATSSTPTAVCARSSRAIPRARGTRTRRTSPRRFAQIVVRQFMEDSGSRA
jgi:hypothetical protein